MTEAAAFPLATRMLAAIARRPFATLFLVFFIAWLPGFFSVPPLDRDESRFAQSSKQMVETGHYIDIHFGNAVRYKKPIGIYWMQAAATEVFGGAKHDRIWTYRIPSLIGAFIAVLLTYLFARIFAPPETALMAAALLGLTVSLKAEALIAKTDAVLLATIIAAQFVLLKSYLAARDKTREPPGLWLALGGWAAFGISILVKGPVILGVLGVTIAALSIWDRDLSWLKTVRAGLGIPLALAIVLPWALAIEAASHGQFYQQAVGHDFAGKLVGGQETHGAPPGYYLLLATATLWPVTMFALPGIGAAIVKRKEPLMRFLLAWAGASWLMFEAVPTKLPHYILPAYPAIACLAAIWAASLREENEPRWQKALRIVAIVQFAIGAAALAALPIVLPDIYGAGTAWWLIVPALAGAAAGIAAIVFLIRRENRAALLAGAAAALVFYATATGLVAPRLEKIWVSPRLAALVAKDRHPGDPPVIASGFTEPSLVFLLGTETQLMDAQHAADLAAQQGGLALIESKERGKFLAGLAAAGASARPVDGMTGLNYSRGKLVHITIYRIRQRHQVTAPPPE